MERQPQCKPGEAYTLFITATCEAGLRKSHMCTLEICMWSLKISEFADECYFHYSTFDFPKYHLFIEIMKYFVARQC
jgi:hypothetical protein